MGVALITPFKTDESIDFDALARIVEHQIKNRHRLSCCVWYNG